MTITADRYIPYLVADFLDILKKAVSRLEFTFDI